MPDVPQVPPPDEDFAASLGCAFFAAWFGIPLYIWGYQLYERLRFGMSTPRSVVDFLEWVGVAWASNPTDWYGLHSVLSGMPLAVAVLLLGGVIFWIFVTVERASR